MSEQRIINPSLFNYVSLRDFLLESAKIKKAQSTVWNHSRWAKQLGLSNTATLTRILHGDRHPGRKLLDALASHFCLSSDERGYLEWIALKDKS